MEDPEVISGLNSQYSKCPWQIKRFAAKLKQIASLLTGIPVEKFEDQAFKETYLGPEWDMYGLRRDGGIYGPARWYGSLAEVRASGEYALADKAKRAPELYIDKRIRTVRSLLQSLGTDALRDVIHPSVHVNALFSDWATKTLTQDREGKVGLDVMTQVPTQRWLISDMRFPNELAAVEARGGLTIRINRPGHDSGNTHPSETALDGAAFNYVITNDGTLEELVGEVREILTAENLI